MKTWLMAAGLLAITAGPAAAQVYGGWRDDYRGDRYGRQIDARLLVDGDREEFRRGERLRVGFATSADAFVAVLHIDTDGRLEFIYPTSPFDDGHVRGGRTYWLPQRGFDRGMLVRGSAGIGYFYIVASPVPLDFSYFRRSGVGRWDWDFAGNAVHGDPFWALDQITRLLIPEWGYVPYGADYYSYYVGGRHDYPRYACSDRYDGRGWGWSSSYGSCDRLDGFLSSNPYYYDTRRYRGDRRDYLREFEERQPLHGYKEPVGQAPPVRNNVPVRPDVRSYRPMPGQPPRVEPSRPPARGVVRGRTRPVLERRPVPVVRDTVRAQPNRRGIPDRP
ncbi:MAG TPA: DUF4384 domain-containing protein [Longimicrobiaceae bacterium]|nr:DUF4384 domain-containing protein [Longimicrobiaceae bacterium]